MFKKLVSVASSLALGVVCLTGCSQNNTNKTTTEKTELDKVTIAEVTHSVFYAPQYAAISQGFFEDEGIEVDLINTQGADKTMAALISGEADIGLMGPEASIYVYNQGSDDYAINFAQLTQRDGSFLVSREKNDNFSYEDLKGTEILGGRKGGVPLMTLEYVLKQHGLSIGEDDPSADVNVRTDVQFGVMAGAFAAGEADYTTAFEPTASQLEKDGSGYVVASIGADSGEIPFTAYSATKSYMEQNKDLVQRFTNALYKAQQWIQTASDEDVAKAMQPFFEDNSIDDLIIVAQKYREIDAWCSEPVLSEESLNNLMKVMETADQLDQRPPYSSIVTTEFAENAVNNTK
ncbi:ABC transporter substrate-binding protein [Romboutsia ilealis]|uniref:ABC transporter substrate-binding protein n=1 Tax=Romboutsia faecis TaxID=2764597 RepID=A0ABR7JQC2_9FIRM|nr:ABC transporter substrate-binding protein [Romboutsia faecis]MBC5996801.1 ABC transporter substrate-binding protein [Romboutsia faecis]MRN24693.1 ABC transporter substrate-binding protein [Romboutsia ilealis]